ncbi:chemotaxis protein CheW [Chitiniphilus purpureus]|uniref:Chemotaxis protein CheW n=1 Tax=Chitiniphilus purpureus TaxID=2981137 RepID=A0ABY6DNY2_9NEIS|nr:chemotaxis protein CheW [Chitiniphilus sp. CD1]UXY15737.1 chemotaxis protein CheW [Chitiniphilus sp. CD1]
MAKRISLREYQEGVVARLKTATATAQVDARLGVRIDNRNWLIDLADVAEVMPVPTISPVPLAHPWFRGTANIRGNLVSVSDLAWFFGGTPLLSNPANRLVLLHPRHLPHAAVLVERMLGLKHLADLTEVEADGGGNWNGAQYDDAAGTRWQVLEIPKLASEPTFLQAGLN